MPNDFHKNSVDDDNHALTARTYADITARDADTTFQVTANIDKKVHVTSPAGYFMLFSVGPVIWIETSSTGNDDFLDLLDTFASYSGEAGKVIQVNTGETALETGQQLRTTDSPTFVQATLGNTGLIVGTSTPFSDSTGVLTLQNIDVLDATTETTIESAVDTLVNLTSVQGQTISLSGSLTVESTSVLNQDLTTDANVTFNQATVGNTGLVVGTSTPFSDATGTLTLQNIDVLDITTETTIEAAIDTLVNLTSVQGQSLSLSGSLTVESASIVNQDLTTDANVTFNQITIGTSVPFSDTTGTLTLQNVDVLDAATETTIEAAIDTLANLTSIQGQTVSISGALTVESASAINQDLTTDASPQFTDLTLTGDLTVQGTTTTIDSTTLLVEDKNIEIGNVTTPTDVTADGGGITLKGTTDKTIIWTNSTDSWDFNQNVSVTGNIIVSGTVDGIDIASDVAANTTHRSSDGTDHSDVVLNNTHRSSVGTDHSDVVLNNTHRGSDGKDHSDVVLNNTHRTSTGADHTFIDQAVTITSDVIFNSVGIGVSTADNKLHVEDNTVLVGKFVNIEASSATAGAFLSLYTDDGAATSNDHRLGGIFMGGANDASNTLVEGSSIESFATQNWSGAANGSDLRFFVTTDGAISSTQAMFIDEGGFVAISPETFTPLADLHIARQSSGTPSIIVQLAQNGTTEMAIEFKRSRQTLGSPFALVGVVPLGSIAVNGCHNNSGNFDGRQSLIEFATTQTWSDTNRGLDVKFFTRPNDTSAAVTNVMTLNESGSTTLPVYGSGTFTGTEAFLLAIDSSGNIIESDGSAFNDNLGNHIMSQDLETNGFFISRDGAANGILVVNTAGDLVIGGDGVTSAEGKIHTTSNGSGDKGNIVLQLAEAAAAGSSLIFKRSRGTLVSAGSLLSGDVLGNIEVRGAHTAATFDSAQPVIQTRTTEVWSSSAMGFETAFYARVNGSSSASIQAMVITNDGNITVTGTVDGRDIATDGLDLDNLNTTIGLSALTSAEVDQLENIGTTTISSSQWGNVGSMNQNVNNTAIVSFARIDIDNIRIDADIISTTANDALIQFTPDGTGRVRANSNMDVSSGNNYRINNVSVLTSTTLGSAVVNSSLTNLGTLTTLNLSGNLTTTALIDGIDIATDVPLNTTHRGSDGKDHSDVVLNNTHRGSDGTDHSNVVLNDTHRTSDGSDHTFIDQNVTTIGIPTFSQLNIDNLRLDGNILSSQNSNGFIQLTPDGTGSILLASQVSMGGITAPTTDASLDLKATDKALLHNRLTTTERDALTATEGMVVYNTTVDDVEFYNGVSWQGMGGGDVAGPASVVDNAITTFVGTGGKNIDDESVTLVGSQFETTNSTFVFKTDATTSTRRTQFFDGGVELNLGFMLASAPFDLPTVVGDRVKIGRINMRSSNGMPLSMQIGTRGTLQVSRKYEMMSGSSMPVGGLQEIRPSQESSISNLTINDFTLEIDVAGSNMHLYARRTVGTTAISGHFSAIFTGQGASSDTPVWVADGGAIDTVTAPTVISPTSMIHQIHNTGTGGVSDTLELGTGSTILDVSGIVKQPVTFQSGNVGDLIVPTFLDSIDIGNGPFSGGKLRGDFYYVADSTADTLAIVNVSDPSDLALVGSVIISSTNFGGIEVTGGFVYLADTNPDQMHVANVTDPTNPIFISTLVLTTVVNPRAIRVINNIAYLQGDGHVVSVDVSNPDFPVQLDTLALPASGNAAITMEADSNFLYLGSRAATDNFIIINIVDPSNLSVEDSLTIGLVRGIFKENHIFYFSDGSNLHAIDVSDPTTAVSLGSDSITGEPRALVVQNSIAYVCLQTSDTWQIYDISDITDIVQISNLSTGEGQNPVAIDVSNGTVYVLDGNEDFLKTYSIPVTIIQNLRVGDGRFARLEVQDELYVEKKLEADRIGVGGGGINCAGSITTTVDSVTRLVSQQSNNLVQIFTAAQMPTTLVTGKHYMIMAPITITAGNEITIPVAANITIQSSDRVNNTITYSGTTGTLFTSTLMTGTVQFSDVDLLGGLNTSRLFNLTGSGFPALSLNKCSVRNWGVVSILTGFQSGIDLGKFGWSGNLGGLFDISDTVFFGMENTFGQNFSDTSSNMFTIGSDVDRVAITLTGFVAQPNERLLDIDSSFTGNVIVNNVFGIAANRVFDATGLDETSIYVDSQHVTNNKNSKAIGSYDFNGNTDVTTISDGTYIAIDHTGVTAGSNIELFTLTDATVGELTYIGIPDFEGILAASFYSGSTPSEANYRLAVSINGAVPTFATAPYVPLSLKDTGDGSTLIFPVSLTTGDTIQIMIAGDGSATDVAIAHGQLSIQ